MIYKSQYNNEYNNMNAFKWLSYSTFPKYSSRLLAIFLFQSAWQRWLPKKPQWCLPTCAVPLSILDPGAESGLSSNVLFPISSQIDQWRLLHIKILGFWHLAQVLPLNNLHAEVCRGSNCATRFLNQFEAKRIEALEIGSLLTKI